MEKRIEFGTCKNLGGGQIEVHSVPCPIDLAVPPWIQNHFPDTSLGGEFDHDVP
jgi:hypothetical protein